MYMMWIKNSRLDAGRAACAQTCRHTDLRRSENAKLQGWFTAPTEEEVKALAKYVAGAALQGK